MNANIIYLYILAIIFSIVPPLFIKLSVKTEDSIKKQIYLVLTIFFYIGMTFIYYELFSKQDMTKVYTSLNILTLIGVVIFGYFFFKENLDYSIIIGIFFGILGIVLIES
jgi:multidrug transporter EmrE-like cation transporter